MSVILLYNFVIKSSNVVQSAEFFIAKFILFVTPSSTNLFICHPEHYKANRRSEVKTNARYLYSLQNFTHTAFFCNIIAEGWKGVR